MKSKLTWFWCHWGSLHKSMDPDQFKLPNLNKSGFMQNCLHSVNSCLFAAEFDKKYRGSAGIHICNKGMEIRGENHTVLALPQQKCRSRLAIYSVDTIWILWIYIDLDGSCHTASPILNVFCIMTICCEFDNGFFFFFLLL